MKIAIHPTTAALTLGAALVWDAGFARAEEVSATRPDGDDVLGRVGELELRLSDVRRNLENLSESERDALRREPATLNHFVRSLLVQQLVLREALAAGWDKSAVVEERLQTLREGVIANTYLESISQPPPGFPAEADLVAAYEANKSALIVPKSWRLAQLYISDPQRDDDSQGSPEALAKLERVRQGLAAQEGSFEALARAESEEPASAARGGEIGWLAEDKIHPNVLAALPGLAVGQTSEPVRMPDGWHFIKVLDAREAYTPSLEQVRDQLGERLRAEMGLIESQNHLARLLQQNPIAINEMTLSKLIPSETN